VIRCSLRNISYSNPSRAGLFLARPLQNARCPSFSTNYRRWYAFCVHSSEDTACKGKETCSQTRGEIPGHSDVCLSVSSKFCGAKVSHRTSEKPSLVETVKQAASSVLNATASTLSTDRASTAPPSAPMAPQPKIPGNPELPVVPTLEFLDVKIPRPSDTIEPEMQVQIVRPLPSPSLTWLISCSF